ncbi:MAG: 5'-methylthioadenosine/S-adenosylhomocysteine nucleosidase [Polyangiaceae bacterium]|nr:5'-methylthioadenosine/S-adenosylhomocysteine nucleosidase [Polyangiaceae bacterium]
MEHIEALGALLLRLFPDSGQVRRELRSHSKLRELDGDLPGAIAGRAQVVDAVVELLDARRLGLVFLDVLLGKEIYAGRHDEIRRVRALWVRAAEQATDASSGSSSTARQQVINHGTVGQQFNVAGNATINLSGGTMSTPSTAQGADSELPTIVILTALEVEYEAVRAHLTDPKEEVHPKGTIYEVAPYPAENPFCRLAIVEVGAGNRGAAVAAERAIQHFSPRFVFFVGVAGGLKDVKVGDVVLSTKVYGYEGGKEAEGGFRPRPVAFNTSAKLAERAKAVRRAHNRGKPDFRAFLGPIAAGEKVVANSKSETARLIKRVYGDALAVEMEGVGFLEAAHQSHAEALVVRGISDLLDGKSADDAEGSQERASENAAAMAFGVLEGLSSGLGPR